MRSTPTTFDDHRSTSMGRVFMKSAAPLAAILLALAGPGCQTSTKGGAEGESRTNAGTRSDPAANEEPGGIPDELAPEPAPGSADALAQQAERDVEAFRTLRRRRAEEAAAPTEVGEPAAGSPPPIQWNPHRTARVTPQAPPAAPPLARSADPPVEVEALPASTTARPPAAAGTKVDDLDMQLVRLRQKLYRASIGSSQPIRELIAIAAMSIVDPGLELPDGANRELTEEEEELLHELHAFFAELGRRLGSGDAAAETIVSTVQQLQQSLVPEPRLELPAAYLCWRIGGFGDFDRFDRMAFLAHNEQQVILYLEIDGFSSTRNEKGQWVTEVSQRLEIYSHSDGIPVWSEPWQKAVDVTHKERRDFFTTQLITLPKPLSVGRYHLKIQVRDEASGAEAEESIQFEMVADPKLASQVPSS